MNNGFGKILDGKITSNYRQHALDTLKFLLDFRFSSDGKGLTNEQIAGIMGNATEESGFDPNALSGQYNGLWLNGKAIRKYMDNHNYPKGYGRDALYRYLSEWLNSDGIKTRLDELSYGNMSGAGYRKGNHSTAANSAITFLNTYENNNGKGRKNRMIYANAWYDYINSSKKPNPTITQPKFNIPPITMLPDALRVKQVIPLLLTIYRKLNGGKLIPKALLGTIIHRLPYTTKIVKSAIKLLLKVPTFFKYSGPKHSVKELFKSDGTINIRNVKKIHDELVKHTGGVSAVARKENPMWHPTDTNTFKHTKEVVLRAYKAGYSLELIAAALMHDMGKLVAGEGHGPIGASLAYLMFPDLTPNLFRAIYSHMEEVPLDIFSKSIKGVDIKEPNIFRKSISSGEVPQRAHSTYNPSLVSLQEYELFGKNIKRFNILDLNNKVGRVEVSFWPKNKYRTNNTMGILLIEANKGNGYGLKTYLLLSELFPEYLLISDETALSEDAIKMWDRLVLQGKAEKLGPKLYRYLNKEVPRGGLAGPVVELPRISNISLAERLGTKSNENYIDLTDVDYLDSFLQKNPALITDNIPLINYVNLRNVDLINDSYGRFTSQIRDEIPNFSWDKLLDGSTYNTRNTVMLLELEDVPVITYNIPFNGRHNELMGLFNGEKIFINGNTPIINRIFNHESNHAFRGKIYRYMFLNNPSRQGGRYGSGYFPKERDMLDNAYEFTDDYIKSTFSSESDLLAEKGATNREMVEVLSDENNGILGTDLDKVIDTLTLQDIKRLMLKVESSYARDFIKTLSESKVPYIKESMKKVGMVSVPITLGTTYGVSKNKRGGKLIPKGLLGSKANTFIGRMTEAFGGDENAVTKADVASSAASFTPLGLVTGALDLGMDANRLYHNQNLENVGNVGLDIASMIPFIPKVRFNLMKKSSNPIMWRLKNFLKLYGKKLNNMIWGAKGIDAYTDTTDGRHNNIDKNLVKVKKAN